MFLSSWRKLVQKVRQQGGRSRRGQRQPSEARKSPWLWVEPLEERNLLSVNVAIWTPSSAIGGVYQWSNPANWSTSIVPSNPGDIAVFSGSLIDPNTGNVANPTLNISETVGEIDFNSRSTFNIGVQNGAVLTLDGTGSSSGTSIINALPTNTGTVTINPQLLAANTPFAGTISGGTVALDNLGGNNSFTVGGNTGSFTVNNFGTLVSEAVNNTGSANLVLNAGGAFTANASNNSIANMGTVGNVTLSGGSFNFVGIAAGSTNTSIAVGTFSASLPAVQRSRPPRTPVPRSRLRALPWSAMSEPR